MPHPDPSINDDQLEEQITGELIQASGKPQDVDPLNALLTESFSAEIDDERLYTDEFIRANENASRSLFLGFLGIALLGTSLFAWFILSRPTSRHTEPSPPPISVPNEPSGTSPNFNNNPQPTVPSVPSPTPSSPGTEQPQAPLVFPVTPTPPSSPPPSPPIPSEAPASPPSSSTP